MAVDEKANGNDLEIFIETPKGYLLMACQAKIVRGNYKYLSISHKGKAGKEQIDLLLDYAEQKKGIAAYLLYNYSDHYFWNIDLEDKIGYPVECLGCSLADASFLKENYYRPQTMDKRAGWRIPSFYDLHPDFAMPLYFIGYPDIEKWFPFEKSLNNDASIKFYSRDEINKDMGWKKIIKPGAIGRISHKGNETNLEPIAKEYMPVGFKPKFRIIFSDKVKIQGLFRQIG